MTPADRFVAQLELDLDRGVCHACLSFVAFPLDAGDHREAERWVRRMTPDLWADGLDEPLLREARWACERGVPGAAAALDELIRNGGRSSIARAAVRRLAGELVERMRHGRLLREAARLGGAEGDPMLN